MGLLLAVAVALPGFMTTVVQAEDDVASVIQFEDESHPQVAYGSSLYTPLSPYKLGVQAYREGAYAKALAYLKQAQKQEATNPNLRYYLAIVLDKLARGTEAVPHYQYVVSYASDEKIKEYSQYRLETLRQDPAQTLSHIDLNRGVTVDLTPHRNALMVEATLNDTVSGKFIVDTGATYTSISKEMAAALGDNLEQIGTVRITTANGRIDVPKVLIKTINLNGLEAHNVEATVIDVRRDSSFTGLLGLSFIRQFKLTIDPSQGQLVFHAI